MRHRKGYANSTHFVWSNKDCNKCRLLQKKRHCLLAYNTVHSSSFHVPGRISTSQGKQYSTNTDYMRQNGTVRQMNDLLLVKFMWIWTSVYLENR